MQQCAEALLREYPDVFQENQLQEHIDDLIRRFLNRRLGDTVFRVGCDLYRKLSADDRIITPLKSAYNHGLSYHGIIEVLNAALQFKATGSNGMMYPSDIDFHVELKEKGLLYIFQKVCGFSVQEATFFMYQLKESVL